jgi:Protein of unknown function (DUF732)
MQLKQLTAWAIAVPLTSLSIGVAHADSNDDDFIQKVKNVGVAGAPADLINNAHLVCKSVASGSTPDDVTDAFVKQMGFQSGVAAQFVSISVMHYCAQYGDIPFKEPH